MSDARDKSETGFLPLSGPGASAPEPPQVEGYELLGWLGGGGMGAVWRAKQLSTGRDVALKVMNQRALWSPGAARSRFEREVTIAAHLEHPNIARVYESGIHKNHHFYAMELIEGLPLDEYVRAHGLSVRAIVQLTHGVCLAVQYAHQHGIIHRDLKPSNILVTPDGQPHILDFGLARDLLANPEDRWVSLDGDLIGTLPFMSPEQAAGQLDRVDTRSDVYSLGVILYRLLTGRFPYDVAGPTAEILRNIASVDPQKPKSSLGRLDPDIETVLLKTLAKDPAERYPSAAELAEEIRRWLAGLPIDAKAMHTLYVVRKLIRRQAWASAVVGLLVVISLAFVSSFLYLYVLWHHERATSQALQVELDRYCAVEQRMMDQLLFDLGLDIWQQGGDDFPKGRDTAATDRTREQYAADFLLDPRPVSEKAPAFVARLGDGERFFATLVLAEHHLRDGDRPRALELFRRSLEYRRHRLQDPVLQSRVQRRIAELARTVSGEARGGRTQP